ncbi:MAG: hypothetical protein Q8S00_13040 [Deltaproteobacteria bacterium]|nr:hypothetical protein [Deltaproteobacteria bacterium]
MRYKILMIPRNVIAVALALLLQFQLVTPRNVLAADELPSGKTFWMISDTEAYRRHVFYDFWTFRRQLGEEITWVKILGKSTPNHYGVELSNGKQDTIWSDWVDKAVEKKILLDYDPAAKAAAEAARAKKAAIAAREAHVKLVESKPWPAEIKKKILERKVEIGMTAEQVTLSWGKPQRVNRTVGGWGSHEQWIYGSTYLYFENDKLTSFQESQ